MDNQSENKEKEGKTVNVENILDIFKHCARINSEITRMNRSQLIEKLNYYNLNTEGSVSALRGRLIANYRRFKSADIEVDIKCPEFPYYVIIDFEATCLEKNQRDFPHEIIEFPAVLVNSSTLEVEDTFRMYCKPVINPKLSDFCVSLTGITQEQVDAAENFQVVFKQFESWLKKHKLMEKKKFSVVADTPWDMTRFLYQQCVYSKIQFPHWGSRWVNIKRSFRKFYRVRGRSLVAMMRFFNMEFDGRLHCGLDDARNLARIVIRMIQDGAELMQNEMISIPRRRPRNNFRPLNEGKEDDVNNEGWMKVESQPVRADFRPIRSTPNYSYEKKLREKASIILNMEKELMASYAREGKKDDDESPVEWLPKEMIKEYDTASENN